MNAASPVVRFLHTRLRRGRKDRRGWCAGWDAEEGLCGAAASTRQDVRTAHVLILEIDVLRLLVSRTGAQFAVLRFLPRSHATDVCVGVCVSVVIGLIACAPALWPV
jgi:hypothetical protein